MFYKKHFSFFEYTISIFVFLLFLMFLFRGYSFVEKTKNEINKKQLMLSVTQNLIETIKNNENINLVETYSFKYKIEKINYNNYYDEIVVKVFDSKDNIELKTYIEK